MRRYLTYLPVAGTFLLVLFLVVPACRSAEWIWYYSTVSAPDRSGNTITIREFFDASTIERTEKGTVVCRTKAVVEGDPPGKIDTILRHTEINCKEGSFRALKTERFFKGRLVDGSSVNAEKWEKFTSGSGWDVFCEAVLKKHKGRLQ